MFKLNGIRFDLVWRSELSYYDDLEFHSLAVRTEGKLLELIVKKLKIEEVVAVKIDAARKGSVVFDSVILARDGSDIDDIMRRLTDIFNSKKSGTQKVLEEMRVIRNSLPQ